MYNAWFDATEPTGSISVISVDACVDLVYVSLSLANEATTLSAVTGEGLFALVAPHRCTMYPLATLTVSHKCVLVSDGSEMSELSSRHWQAVLSSRRLKMASRRSYLNCTNARLINSVD